MIDKFCEWFEGEWNNQQQAFSNPTRFAMIEVFHEKIENNKFSIMQQYMIDKNPYRQAIVEVVQLDDYTILLKNYREDLTPLTGCDIIVKYSSKNEEFVGSNMTNDCIIPRMHNGVIVETFLSTQFVLQEKTYKVMDKGISMESGKQIWGSEYGMFEFTKQPVR